MTIVRESLNEFKRGQEPKEALKIGGELKNIKNWLRPFLFGSQYKVNDWEIDIVKGDFIAYSENIPVFPEYIQFNSCVGAFIIESKGLKSMIGGPKTIEGDFHVPGNELIDLNGCPEYVGGDFNISGNPGDFSVADIEKICDVKGKISV